MNTQSIYFVGTQAEIGHHASPVLSSILADEFQMGVREPDEVLQFAAPGDLVVVYSEHFDRFRKVVNAMRSRQVATLYLVDGILEWRNAWENRHDEPACPFTMRPVLSDKVACIGVGQAKVLAEWGNGGKIEVVGVPRFDGMLADYNFEQNSSPPVFKSQTELRLLIATAKCPGFTPGQVELTQASLADLRDWLAATQEIAGRKIQVCWRLTAGLEQDLGVDSDRTAPQGSLMEQLDWADVVVTTPSTLMLEAMLKRLPTVLLNYHECPVYVPGAWQIASASQISGVFQSVLDPVSGCRRMKFQESILSQELCVSSCDKESATSRFCRLAGTMLQTAASQISLGCSGLEFPPGILDMPHPAPYWDSAIVFPQFEEFRRDDEQVMRTELAHARREIDFLNRELRQARSELKQAHEIFEHIHRHPIAGPIVRIRKRILDWMNGSVAQPDQPSEALSSSVDESSPMSETRGPS